MPTPEELIDLLLSGVEGQIAACNIVAGVAQGVIEPSFVAKAFGLLARLADLNSFAASSDVVNALAVVGQGAYPTEMDREGRVPAMWLSGQGDFADDDPPTEVTTVMPVSSLRYLLPDTKEAQLMALGLSLAAEAAAGPPEPEAPQAVALLQKQRAEWRRVPLRPGATVGVPGHLLWFTSREQLNTAMADEDASARGQRARDVLGLNHRKAGETLIAVHFVGSAVADSSAKPTFIDAGTHRRFMGRPETEAGRADLAWGRTVDLHAFAERSDVIDGCGERVATEVGADMLPDGGIFEFEMLGTVTVASGTGDDEDRAFAARLQQRNRIADLKAELTEIVGWERESDHGPGK